MKTSLTIATIALAFSAILSLAPTVATADYSGKTPGRCGVAPCPDQQQAQRICSRHRRPHIAASGRPMKMHARLMKCMLDWPLPLGRPIDPPF
jgi:hypothetical protein